MNRLMQVCGAAIVAVALAGCASMWQPIHAVQAKEGILTSPSGMTLYTFDKDVAGSGKSVSAMSIVRLLPENAIVGVDSRISLAGRNLRTASEDELRKIKDSLPDGSIRQLAKEFDVTEETVRNYFGGANYTHGTSVGIHIEPGPNGGIVLIDDASILNRAQEILEAHV